MNPGKSSLVPVVAVDGPSGAGKGMVTRELRDKLPGWHLLDSGALYRVLALAAVERGIDLAEANRVAALADQLSIEFPETAGPEQILLDGIDIAGKVRSESTGGLASRIAVYPPVRAALLQRQRRFRQPPGLIADGRDMGTQVFPDAVLKIFLEASPGERALRRYKQLIEMGQNANLDSLRTEISQRDERDRKRLIAPLVPAQDAVTIDTTGLPPASVLAQVDELLKSRGLL